MGWPDHRQLDNHRAGNRAGVRPRATWHRLLHVVAWAVLLFFLASAVGSIVVTIINALK